MNSIVHSFRVATTILEQRIVGLFSGSAGFVGYPEDTTELPIGITLDRVNETTGVIPVAGIGSIARVLFNDTVASGALVAADTSGRGIPFTLANTTTQLTLSAAYAGLLTGRAVNLTALVSEVYLAPGYESGA